MERGKKKELILVSAFLLVLIAFLVFFYLDLSSKNLNVNVIETPETCNDTDGGINYFVQGITSGINRYFVKGEFPDFCSSEVNLSEYSCENDFVVKETYDCSLNNATCFEGRCLEVPKDLEDPEVNTCNDTDGLNYTNAGSVYGQLIIDGPAVTKYDVCNSIDVLTEYFCEGDPDLIMKEEFPCSKISNESFCLSGACIVKENSSSPSNVTCISTGNFCLDNSSVCFGNLLNFSCSENQVCCDVDANLQNSSSTCLELNGTICNLTQYCFEGETYSSLGLTFGEVCCVGGNCAEEITYQEPMILNNFQNISGSPCVGDFCETNESSEFSAITCGPGEDCDIENSLSKEDKNYWWLWLIVVLILVGGFAFLFFTIRERLKLRKEFVKNSAKTNSVQLKSSETNSTQSNPKKTL